MQEPPQSWPPVVAHGCSLSRVAPTTAATTTAAIAAAAVASTTLPAPPLLEVGRSGTSAGGGGVAPRGARDAARPADGNDGLAGPGSRPSWPLVALSGTRSRPCRRGRPRPRRRSTTRHRRPGLCAAAVTVTLSRHWRPWREYCTPSRRTSNLSSSNGVAPRLGPEHGV